MPQEDEALARNAYDTVADVYADHVTGTDPEQPLELAMIDHFASLLQTPRRVLDAGCGAGRMLPYLSAKGCDPEGIDISPQMIARARRDHPSFPVRVGSLTSLDLPDASFEGVFSWYSTIHNPDDDLDQMICEMTRVLIPRGLLLVAFQTGQGMRRVGQGFRAHGFEVIMHRYHRSAIDLIERLQVHELSIVSSLDRAPVGDEPDGQAVVIARRAG